MPKDFLTLLDFEPSQVETLVNEAATIKEKQGNDKPLAGKSIAIIFNKSSTRTRMGFEVGMYQLGGYPMVMNINDIQLGRGESISDTAKIISRFVDAAVIRTFAQADIELLAKEATIPVINALTDMYHPCQAIADYATILQKKGKLAGQKLAYIGDGNNVAHSLMIGGVQLGMHIAIATPAGYQPDADVTEKCHAIAAKTGGSLTLTNSPTSAAENADALYTDVWASMGQEHEEKKRIADFAGFTIDQQVLSASKPNSIVLHCLPAHRGEEITAEVLDGSRSVIWDQAENKLHAQKAILKMILGDSHV